MAEANPKSQSFTITCVNLSRRAGGAGKSEIAKLHNYLCFTITCVNLSWRGGGTGKSEVAQLHNSHLGDEDVFRLHISVDNLGGKNKLFTESFLSSLLPDYRER